MRVIQIQDSEVLIVKQEIIIIIFMKPEIIKNLKIIKIKIIMIIEAQ
jgi:hypothetical protein